MTTTTQTEWSVLVEWGGDEPTDDQLGDLAERLAPYSAAITGGAGHGLGARLAIDADTAQDAIATATSITLNAARNIGLNVFHVEHAEATEWHRFAAELEHPNFPDIVGHAEVADIIGVTKQRLTALRQRDDFPDPLLELKAGPIWLRASIDTFLDNWSRKPGRPARAPELDAITDHAFLGAAIKADHESILDHMTIGPGSHTRPGVGGYGMKITNDHQTATDYFATIAKMRPTDPNAAALGLLVGLVIFGVLEWKDRRRNALNLNTTAAADVTLPGDLADVINLAERLAARHAGQVPMHEFAIEVGANVPAGQLKAQLSTELDHVTGA